MVEAINSFFNIFPDWLHVFFISAVPIIELRGAIPYGILLLDMHYLSVLFFSILGSMLPAPFILYLGENILTKMAGMKSKRISRFAIKLRENSLRKGGKIEKFTYIGLMLFIAVPLPGTGVWTGCLIAALLNLNPVKSILASFCGTAIAGIIVTTLVEGGILLVSS